MTKEEVQEAFSFAHECAMKVPNDWQREAFNKVFDALTYNRLWDANLTSQPFLDKAIPPESLGLG